LFAGKPSVGDVSDFGALSGPNARIAKIKPISRVTHEVLRPVMNEVIAFKINPLILGTVFIVALRQQKGPGVYPESFCFEVL
jgi:hypothetical protein